MSASSDPHQPSIRLVTSDAERDLLDEPTLASRLGISRATLQSWRYAGRGPRFIKLGRMVRYRAGDVEAYLRANTHGDAG